MELPRQERIGWLAASWEDSASNVLKRLAETCELKLNENPKFAEDATKLLPLKLIHEYQCLPLEEDNGLRLATVWPPSKEMSDWVYALTGEKAQWELGDPDTIVYAITQSFGVGSGSLDEGDMDWVEEESADESEDQNAAVIRFVNEIVQKAIADRATDIHFEPLKDELQIRYRIDGELVPVRVPDNLIRFQGAIISRLKIMAKLNISEKRRPQDGRISFNLGKTELDIRISTFPTMYGESVSLRLLNEKNMPLSISELGFLEDDQETINKSLSRPHGIILVTGPTGSGKSTSLSAFIRKINHPERRIITVEDPVEYEIPGINQTQVKPEVGLNFAAALRHILRQDPDVIMIGEIRDRETADIAIRASLTGHLVLSTLHTNDAPGALTRLIDMEIEPFLIASSVELVIAQRLVRRLCPACAKPQKFEPGQLESILATLHLNAEEIKHAEKVKAPVGCDACRNLGYRGRVAIIEVLKNSDEIHELIVKKASARVIRETAIAQKMRSLQQCGWEQVKRGMTSVDEIMRFAEMGEEEGEE